MSENNTNKQPGSSEEPNESAKPVQIHGETSESPADIPSTSDLAKALAAFMGEVDIDALQAKLAATTLRSPAFVNKINEFQEIVKNTAMLFAAAQKNKFLDESLRDLMSWMRGIAENANALIAGLEMIEGIEPYLLEELKKPEYGGITIEELLEIENTDENGNHIEGNLLDRALDAAAAAKAAQSEHKLPTTTIKRAELLELPLDKVNATIWNLLEKDTGGQLAFAMEKRGSSKEITLLYSIDFDEALSEGIQITKRLLPFDKRVYIAINALFNAGNNIITLTQIYYAMGYKGKPGTKDLQKIQASILKMQGAQISVDNEQEAATYKKYGKFVYKGSLLPIETAEHYNVNGALTDAAIHIFREPPLISFAKQRNQITTVEIKLLQSPINKTDNNLLIDDYLIERISRMKNSHGKSSNKILFNTIFENARITESKKKQRSKATIKRYLEHYKQCGFIKDYKEASDGVTILY